MQGQDTLVVKGGDTKKSYRIGAGAAIHVSKDGDAKFIGVNSTGLVEMRQSLENDKTLAQQKSGNLIDTRSKSKESGEAMNTRMGAQTATLHQLAIAGAYGLESLLKIIAQWIGANPDDVKITPNLEFSDDSMRGRDLVDLMTAKTLGAPLSDKSIHKLQQDKGLTKLTYDEEMDALDTEEPRMTGLEGTNPGLLPTGDAAKKGTGTGTDKEKDPSKDKDLPKDVRQKAPIK
jgi:hypothetical protein